MEMVSSNASGLHTYLFSERMGVQVTSREVSAAMILLRRIWHGSRLRAARHVCRTAFPADAGCNGFFQVLHAISTQRLMHAPAGHPLPERSSRAPSP